MLKRLVLSYVFLLFAASSLVAQTPTTQGKDFWVSYMKNGHRPSTNPLLDCLKRLNRGWEMRLSVVLPLKFPPGDACSGWSRDVYPLSRKGNRFSF